jgi:hypothetical protein
LENSHEGQGIGQENLPELQGDPAQGRGKGHLHRPAPQAAPGLRPAERAKTLILDSENLKLSGFFSAASASGFQPGF